MSKRMTRKGQVTIPRKMRKLLRLTPGDSVEFELSATGGVVMRKASATATNQPPRPRVRRPRVQAQVRRRAAELVLLLRGLD
jgi:antitoxin PrlF